MKKGDRVRILGNPPGSGALTAGRSGVVVEDGAGSILVVADGETDRWSYPSEYLVLLPSLDLDKVQDHIENALCFYQDWRGIVMKLIETNPEIVGPLLKDGGALPSLRKVSIPSPIPPSISEELHEHLLLWAKKGFKIEGIRGIRNETRCSLSDAKKLYEKYYE